jgi:glycine cleavage system protein P-like pyridoxal-binding family
MCTVLLPPGVNPIAVNKYIINFSPSGIQETTMVTKYMDRRKASTIVTQHTIKF